MTDIKDYRNSELKNYVIGNILLVLYFSGMFSKIFSEDVNSNLDIWSIVIESALISSIIYIYVVNGRIRVPFYLLQVMP